VSTSHSASQSASCFPCAWSSTSMFSRLMTRASTPEESTSARSLSATYPASIAGPSRSLLRNSSTETMRAAGASREELDSAAGGGAAVAQAQAARTRKDRMRIRRIVPAIARALSFPADAQLVVLHTQDHFSTLFQIAEEDALEIGRAHVRTPVTSLSRMP